MKTLQIYNKPNTLTQLEYIKMFASKMLKDIENGQELKTIDLVAIEHSILELKQTNNITKLD